MNNFNQVKQEYSAKYKGFGSYAECMTRTLFTGLASFALSFSAIYFLQVLTKKYFPVQPKYYLILPSVLSTSIAWKVTSDRTKICQETWTVSEKKYTTME